MSAFYLGVDIGGTNYSLALANHRGDLLQLIRRRTAAARGAQGVVDGVLRSAPALMRAAQRAGGTVVRLGIGFGGPVDFTARRILLSHHVAGWADYPLCETLESRLGVPTVLDNDGNVGALGEWRFGAGRGQRDLLYVNIGTGIGGALISDGRLLRGTANLAGEIGHVTVNPEGPLCTCGRHGCLESLAAGPYLARKAREAGHAGVTSHDLFEAARAGHRWARALVLEAAEALAFGLGAAACLCNPALIILGGGIGAGEPLLTRAVRRALPRYVMEQNLRALRVVRARLGYDAGVRGAVALAMER